MLRSLCRSALRVAVILLTVVSFAYSLQAQTLPGYQPSYPSAGFANPYYRLGYGYGTYPGFGTGGMNSPYYGYPASPGYSYGGGGYSAYGMYGYGTMPGYGYGGAFNPYYGAGGGYGYGAMNYPGGFGGANYGYNNNPNGAATLGPPTYTQLQLLQSLQFHPPLPSNGGIIGIGTGP